MSELEIIKMNLLKEADLRGEISDEELLELNSLLLKYDLIK